MVDELICLCSRRGKKESERAERAYLTVAPPSKKGNDHNKRFKFKGEKNQGNSLNYPAHVMV